MPQLRLVAVDEIMGAGGAGVENTNVDALTDSIQDVGVLQPLLVRRDRGRYELLAGAKRLAAAVRAGLREVPCLVHEVDDVEARRLAEAANRGAAKTSAMDSLPRRPWADAGTQTVSGILSGSLETILSTLALIDRPGSSLRDQVALGLIRAEAQRASRLILGLELLSADPPVVRRPTNLAAVVRGALASIEDERALIGVSLDSEVPETCIVRADEHLLRIAASGAVETILALLRSHRAATLALTLVRNEMARSVTLSVSEDAVRMPTASWSRWFDENWESRPGGFAAGISLLAARRAAELHDGRLDLSPTQSGGCELSLTLPL